MPDVIEQRLQRLRELCGPVDIEPIEALRQREAFIGVACSRVGLDPTRQRSICRRLCQVLLEARQRRAIVCWSKGSAIDDWASRAVALFRLPHLIIECPIESTPIERPSKFASPDGPSTVRIQGSRVDRDLAVIALADRLEALHLRRNGKIASAISHRLHRYQDACIRVSLSDSAESAAVELIAQGAIGRFVPSPPRPHHATIDREPLNCGHSWARHQGEWLIHCTRQPQGAWPGQSDQQYRDSMLTTGATDQATALDALRRITRKRRLIASAIASDRRYPVVCFSANALAELLKDRTFRPQLKRWDYEPYGVAISISAANRIGIVPVRYGDASAKKLLPAEERYLHQSTGKTYDWRLENEWRHLGDIDLDQLPRDDVRIFVRTQAEAESVRPRCPWMVTAVG
ncbi:MAG: hypothetical protein AAGA03_14150 [Planctomycetota bacterium]